MARLIRKIHKKLSGTNLYSSQPFYARKQGFKTFHDEAGEIKAFRMGVFVFQEFDKKIVGKRLTFFSKCHIIKIQFSIEGVASAQRGKSTTPAKQVWLALNCKTHCKALPLQESVYEQEIQTRLCRFGFFIEKK